MKHYNPTSCLAELSLKLTNLNPEAGDEAF